MMLLELRAALAPAVMVMIAGARRRIRARQSELFITWDVLQRSGVWRWFPAPWGYPAFL